MEPGAGGAGLPDGRRKSSRIPRLNSKFQNTDAEDRLSQILGSQEDEEELRVGAAGVIAQLQAVDEEVADDEPPGLLDGGAQDESDMEDMEENEEVEEVNRARENVLEEDVVDDGNDDPAIQNIDLLLQALGEEEHEGGAGGEGEADGEGEAGGVHPPVEEVEDNEEGRVQRNVAGDFFTQAGEVQQVDVEERGDEEGEVDNDEEVEEAPNGASAQPNAERQEEEEAGGGGVGEHAEQVDLGDEFGDLSGRKSPEVPGPRVTQFEDETPDGWHQIDQLGAFDCFLSRFSSVEDVPHDCQAAWALAWSTVLEREAVAESELAKERALKWFCFLSQGLLRKPRRGGRAGRGAIVKRFRAVLQGDWGSLVTMWQADCNKDEERNRRREYGVRTRGKQREEEEEKEAKLRREVLKLIGSCEVGKAVSRMNSHGVASMSDPGVKEQMASKYPPREMEMPTRVIKGQAVSHLRGLREGFKALRKRKSPGAGGLRPEFLQVVGEKLEADQMRLLENWGIRFLQGDMPGWFYVVWLSIQTVPLYKTSTLDAVRPIGMRNPLSKLLNGLMIGESKQDLVDYFEPQQIAMSQAGSAKLVHCLRLLAENELLKVEARRRMAEGVEEGPIEEEMVGVKIDVKNAFNNCSGKAVITTLEKEESLKHLAWATACQLLPEQPLENGGKQWGTRQTGATQGDTAGPAQFCLSWHPQVRELDATLSAAGGLARFGMDDGYCWGPPAVLFPALEKFKSDIKEQCSLELEVAKSECFAWGGQLPAEAPEEIKLAGAEVNGRWEVGWVVYGCPMGSDAYVAYMMDRKVEEIAKGATRAKEVLKDDPQALWAVLRLSLQQQFSYWISLVHPTQVAAAADRVDTILTGVLETVSGFHMPQGGGQPYTCPMGPEVGWLEGRSYQQIISTLPIKSGGMGLRSQLDLSQAAWVGALEQALPFFAGEKGVCPPLAELSGEEEDDLHRWQPLLNSGLRTGEELRQAWTLQQQRAGEMAAYLGEELGGALAQPVEAAGQGSTSGGTRMAITEQIESLTLATLKKHLQEFPNRRARPVSAMEQKDKMTTSWLLALSTPQGSLSPPIFREGLAMVLSVPSPACGRRLGERIGGKLVDEWGDVVKCVALPGGSWTIRHDKTKTELMRMLRWGGIVSTCEVTGLFQHLVPPEARDRPEVKSQSHVMVPDFRVQLPSSTTGFGLAPGEVATRLAELKFTCSEEQYRTGVRQRDFQRAVDRRAGQLMNEYRTKAERMDEMLGHGGRIRQQLDQYGDLITIVVGKFNELSDGGHKLLEAIAESRVAMTARRAGEAREVRSVEKGVVIGELRRQLSVVNIRASMTCLLDRLEQAGVGGRLATRRQEGILWEEQRMREEREMMWAARVRGQALLQPGRILF